MFHLLQYAFIVLAGASSVIARPAHVARQASNTSIVPITGPTQGGVQPRLEIHQLQQNKDQWNIFLLAIAAFQAMDPSDSMSWYQISGIHGVPYISYADVGQCEGCPSTGYCTHSSTLFPNWHRAYVALFEQSLQVNALAVANAFSGRQRTRYVNAANSLRLPYWDWAMTPPQGEEAFPQMFTQQTVTVNTPTGRQQISNPLQSYSFGSADYSFMSTRYTPDESYTVRNPTFTYSVRQQLQADLYTTLTSSQGYNSFSTESLYSPRDNDNPYSIEMLHDRVHVRVGGDMAYIPTAAYDPVFWLHHSAIDHAFALWQAAYPEDWMESWVEVGATFTYTSGTTEDSSSDLTPFRSNTYGGFWNSDAVRDTTVLGYEYADLASGETAASIINSLYGSGATASKRSTSSHNESTTHNEYIAEMRADAMSTEGSFTVFFFDGEFDEKHCEEWHNAESLIATHSFFTGPEKKGTGKALSNAGASLTAGLQKAVEAGKLGSLDKDKVSAYLKNNLEVRIKMQHGQIVDSDFVPGFEVSFMASEVEMPSSRDQLPSWGPFKKLDV